MRMSDRVFVDTNVLLYAHDLAEASKRAVALARYRELVAADRLVVSTQVLGEFYVNAVRSRANPKRPAMATAEQAERVVTLLAEGDCYTVTPTDCARAMRVARAHRLGYWDALIVVAAAGSGARVLLSEDFRHGQTLEGVLVENPFVSLARARRAAFSRPGEPSPAGPTR